MNLKISQLSATTNPQDSDVFPVVNFGETKKVELRYITNAAFRAAQTAFLPLTGGTVFGNVIVNGDIITSSATSDNWNDTYTIVDANSAMWGGASDVYTTVNANSATWNKAGNVYTTVNANSAIWSGAGDVYTTVNANSADWESAFTTVQAKSGTWESSIDGSGTIGYLPKFTTNSSTLGNSVIYESGSQLKINNPPLSATLNVEGSYLQTVNGNGDYVIRIQDGSGRVNHYWNTVGGTGPTVTYMRPNEGARKILFGGETQPLFQVSSSSLTSPTTGVAGDTIIWEDAFTITSGGNVGIGTSIPNKPLTVSGDISANDIYSDDIYTESLFLSSANPLIRIVDSNAATKDAVTGYIGFYAGNGIVPAAGAGPNRAGWMGFGSTLNNNLQVRNESEDGTVILSVSGNSLGQTTCATFGMYNALSTEFINHIPLKTGIGTDNPTEELTVIGNVEIANSFDPAVLRLTETSGANAIWEMRSYHTSLAGGSGNEFSIYGGEDGQPLADRFVIEPDSGNVGVGFVPVATSSKLTIKGSISASDDIITPSRLKIGFPQKDVETELNTLQTAFAQGFIYRSAKQNITGSNPNIPSYVSTIQETDLTSNTGTNGDNFIGPIRTITIPTTLLGTLPNSRVEAFLIKFNMYGILHRQDGMLGIQVRRNSSDSWGIDVGPTAQTLARLEAGGSAGGYRVSGSATEMIYHDKTNLTFQYRVIDPNTNAYGTIGLTKEYNVDVQILGFYFTLL